MASPKSIVGKLKRLSPENVKIVIFHIKKKKIKTISTQTKLAKFQVFTTDHGSTNISQKDRVSYLYIQADISIPKHIPVNTGKTISVCFGFFLLIPVGEMAQHFRVNFQKYLPKADGMENLAQMV